MTTKALEAHLPTVMQSALSLQAIHGEYLRMPISERMYWPYDYFLRMKVLEHFRQKRERFGCDSITIY